MKGKAPAVVKTTLITGAAPPAAGWVLRARFLPGGPGGHPAAQAPGPA